MRGRRTEIWLGLWTLLFIAATAALAYFRPFPTSQQKHSSGIVLQVTDRDGRLRIDWDPNNELVRQAQGATLEVDDGGVRNRYPVEPKTLRAGGFDYIRKTQEVLLTLTLFHEGKPGALATVRSVSPIEAVVAPPSQASTDNPVARSPGRRGSQHTRARRR
jgi:hypothetical protein